MPDRSGIELARRFRREPTGAEELLWQRLRGGRCAGLKFRRQHPLPGCIADFYCAELLLVVEVDGEVHLEPENRERDANRDEWLASLGLRVLRFTNQQVLTEIESVLNKIAVFAADE
ncbi:MAG: endonuclease domain-containing protein [Actinomycetota bacterium]